MELASKTSNEPTFSEKELIANTLASIRAWRATNLLVPSAQTPQSFMQTESGRQIADVLGVYLGRRAVDSLLQPGEASKITGEESIEGAESVLRVLIGRRGATAIEAKILRMMNQRPESNSESSIS